MASHKATRDHIAKIVVYVFLGVSMLLVASVIIGLSKWTQVKDILQAWSATYSILVGAIFGFYFPLEKASSGATSPSIGNTNGKGAA